MNNPAQLANAINPIRTSLAPAPLRRGFFFLRLRCALPKPFMPNPANLITWLQNKSHSHSEHWRIPLLCSVLVAVLAVSLGELAAGGLPLAVDSQPKKTWLNSFLNLPDALTFTDVSVAAGISEHNCSWGAAWGDYDRDGYIDVMTVGHLLHPHVSICQLWHNNGDGTFTDVTVAAGLLTLGGDAHGPSWADLDNDGNLDLYVAKGTAKDLPVNYNDLWKNNGDGTFTNIAISAGVIGINCHNRGSYAVDYDNDSDLDIFVPSFYKHDSGEANLLYRNDGDFAFTDVAPEADIARSGLENRTAAWADYDLDGWIDVFIAKSSGLYRNRGDGTFEDVSLPAGITTSAYSQDGAWGDFNNDGYPDLYVTMGQESTSAQPSDAACILYRNNGDGTFTDVTAESGVTNTSGSLGVTWGDYDNDGDLDLYVVNTTGAANRLFRNNGDSTFTDVAGLVGVTAKKGGRGSDATFIDYNNDGFLDLFVCNGAGDSYGPYLLFKNNGNLNHWLEIELTGQESNRDGVGVKVTLTAGGLTQYREYTGQHYMAQNHIPVHFGLGGATQVDSLVIQWPSGIRQELDNIPSGQTIAVLEP